MLSNRFHYQLCNLEQIAASLGLDTFALDELIGIEFEVFLHTQEITFAVFEEEELAVFWVLQEVAEKLEEQTDELVTCIVDSLPMVLFNANSHAFVFVRTLLAMQAEEVINSLL